VKGKFKINGKEYGSLEEVPEGLRQSLLKASDKEDASHGTAEGTSSKVIFNGVEYSSLDEMPTYARNLYEQAVNASRTGAKDAGPLGPHSPGSKPIEPEPSFSGKAAAAAFVLIALGLLLYYLLSSRVEPLPASRLVGTVITQPPEPAHSR
jgi:hypothetical protein